MPHCRWNGSETVSATAIVSAATLVVLSPASTMPCTVVSPASFPSSSRVNTKGNGERFPFALRAHLSPVQTRSTRRLDRCSALRLLLVLHCQLCYGTSTSFRAFNRSGLVFSSSRKKWLTFRAFRVHQKACTRWERGRFHPAPSNGAGLPAPIVKRGSNLYARSSIWKV